MFPSKLMLLVFHRLLTVSNCLSICRCDWMIVLLIILLARKRHSGGSCLTSPISHIGSNRLPMDSLDPTFCLYLVIYVECVDLRVTSSRSYPVLAAAGRFPVWRGDVLVKIA